MLLQRWKGLTWVVLALAAVVGLYAPSGEAGERRWVVELDEPFEIGGELYPAGKVTVKCLGNYDPSSVMSEIWVGRECLGMFRASRVDEPSEQSHDTLTFTRTADGHLALVGFVSARSEQRGAYRFRLQARAIERDDPIAQR